MCDVLIEEIDIGQVTNEKGVHTNVHDDFNESHDNEDGSEDHSVINFANNSDQDKQYNEDVYGLSALLLLCVQAKLARVLLSQPSHVIGLCKTIMCARHWGS